MAEGAYLLTIIVSSIFAAEGRRVSVCFSNSLCILQTDFKRLSMDSRNGVVPRPTMIIKTGCCIGILAQGSASKEMSLPGQMCTHESCRGTFGMATCNGMTRNSNTECSWDGCQESVEVGCGLENDMEGKEENNCLVMRRQHGALQWWWSWR